MKFFLFYLKMRSKILVLFLLFAFITGVVNYLYDAPSEASLYAVLLCAALGLIALTVDCIRFHQKYTTLCLLRDNISAGLEQLPEPENIGDEAYTELIRTLETENRRLFSDAKLREQDSADYYTMWVHQIKTPIAAMNLLLQQNPDDELSEQLFRIEQYVEMALTYIRCGNDATDYVLRSASLDDIIKTSVKKYSRSFIRKKLTLRYTETGLRVVTDEKWLGFALEQLISNALKYTRSGSLTIAAENGNTLIVEDTGIGIAAEDLPRICEKGYTGYNGRQEKKSTGIGLFLTKKILDSLGHALTITSELGKGTRVAIRFSNPNIRFE